MRTMIRVFIADDHAVLRAGLRMLLDAESDMEVIGEAADGRDAVKQVVEMKPDVVLLDVSMPHVNGLEALQKIVEKVPDSRVLILTMHNDEGYLRSALAAGGAGYVLKQAADSMLLSAIRVVHQGGTYLHPEHTQALLEQNEDQKASKRLSEEESSDLLRCLSSRELEVLRLIAMGYTNKQAADQLYLSVKTVETYKARLMVKLDLHSRAELVCLALEHGLMTE
jgi:two-component system, NarL family, response regulator NreC